MIRKILLTLVIFPLLTLCTGCGSDNGGNGNGPEPTLPPRLVAELHQDPGFGSVDSQVWDSLVAESIQVGTDSNYNANVLYTTSLMSEMKALVTDSLLYIWTRWNDNDEDNRFGELRAAWANNTVQWAINVPDDTIAKNEDRFYIIFDNGGTNGADCSKLCHSSPSSAGHYFYGSGGDNADVWQWMAHRTGLSNLAEDMHISDTMAAPDPHDSPFDKLYFRNWHSLSHRPYYMHHDTTAYTGAGLLQSETPAGTFRAFENYLDWLVFPLDGSPPVGKTVPGYYIYDSTGTDGSRWDVGAISEHNGTHWTVVFRRKLTTTDADDIDFNSYLHDSLLISIGITDNSGIKHHGVEPFYLVFP